MNKNKSFLINNDSNLRYLDGDYLDCSKINFANDWSIKGLYLKGYEHTLSYRTCAIVGARAAKAESLMITQEISARLVSLSYVIVSGLARGIDTMSHKACLAQGGLTIAVLAHGLDRIYPQENIKLANAICKNGLLVSEYSNSSNIYPANFVRRNRIISLLSEFVVIVQASKTSGSRTTANFASEQNRLVFVYLPKKYSFAYQGSFELVEQGATPFFRASELISYIKNIN